MHPALEAAIPRAVDLAIGLVCGLRQGSLGATA